MLCNPSVLVPVLQMMRSQPNQRELGSASYMPYLQQPSYAAAALANTTIAIVCFRSMAWLHAW